MYLPGQRQGPSPIILGLLIGFLVIVLLALRTCTPQTSENLRSRFAAAGATDTAMQTAGAPVISLPEPVQTWGETAIAGLRGGDKVVPITPVAANTTLQVDIESLQQISGGLQIKGTVRNTGQQELRVPLSAFRFIDQTGTVYAAQGDAAATLPPNASTTLDLTLPINQPTTLTMLVEIPDADIHLELRLLTSSASQ